MCVSSCRIIRATSYDNAPEDFSPRCCCSSPSCIYFTSPAAMQPATVTSSPSYAHHSHATTDILTVQHRSPSLISPTRVTALPLFFPLINYFTIFNHHRQRRRQQRGIMQGSHHRQPTIKQAEGGLPTLIAAAKK